MRREDTYIYAGVSQQFVGETMVGTLPIPQYRWRFRVSNSTGRTAHLAKWGNAKIDIIGLPRAMTRYEAARYLLDIDFAGDDEAIRDCLLATAHKFSVVA